MIEYLNWVIIAMALYGAYLNSKQDVRGFMFWIVTNCYLMVHNLLIGQLAQGCLFAAYLVLAINGLISWKKK
jgi:hypothetical protein